MFKNRNVRPSTGPVCFKKYSRKRYAIFNSIKKTVHIAGLSTAYTMLTMPVMAKAQSDSIIVYQRIEIDEVVVLSEDVAPELIPAAIGTSTREELSQRPHQHVQDYLKSFGNLDVRQRGPQGMQTDLSYRGGTFDQTQVLLNGIPLTDPQTGHLSLSLPIDKESLAQITFYNSASARLLNVNTLGGAVQFTTLHDTASKTHVSTQYGNFNSVRIQGSSSYSQKHVAQHISGSYFQTDGFTNNTDGYTSNILYSVSYSYNKSKIEWISAYQQKAFGANGFYTPKYPDQYEQNDILLLGLKGEYGRKIKIKPLVYWRRHKDRFELFREHPDWYLFEDRFLVKQNETRDTIQWYKNHNHHISNAYGAQIQTLIKSQLGTSSMTLDFRSENIRSNNIGYNTSDLVPIKGFDGYYTKKYGRNNVALHLTHKMDFYEHKVQVIPNLIINWNDQYSSTIDILPSVVTQIKANELIHVNASFVRSMAQPSFTDLFYTDPTNNGNLGLKPYYMNVLDGYFRIGTNRQSVIVGAFIKQGNDVIDWVWYPSQAKFRPVNLESMITKGIETAYRFRTEILGPGYPTTFDAHYTFLKMDKALSDSVSKYNHLQNKLTLYLTQQLGAYFNLTLGMNLQDRQGSYIRYNFDSKEYYSIAYTPYLLADARLNYTLKRFGAFFEIYNLFDAKYVELGSIDQPGRSIHLGVSLSF